MKNKDLINVRKSLDKLMSIEGKHQNIVKKNIEMVDVLLDTFKRFKVIDSTDYNFQRREICIKYSSGFSDSHYNIIDKENFNKEMDDLIYNYTKTVEIMNNECTLNFFKIKKDHLPKNLSVSDLKYLSFMII